MNNRPHRFRFQSPMPGSLDSMLSTPHVHSGGAEMSQTQGSSQFTSEDILGPCDRGWGGLNKRGGDMMSQTSASQNDSILPLGSQKEELKRRRYLETSAETWANGTEVSQMKNRDIDVKDCEGNSVVSLLLSRCHYETTSSIRRLEEDLKKISDRLTILADSSSSHAMIPSNEEQLETIIRRVVAQEIMSISHAQRFMTNATVSQAMKNTIPAALDDLKVHFPAELEGVVKTAVRVEMKLQTAELVSKDRYCTKALSSEIPENVKKAAKHIPTNVERVLRDIPSTVQKIVRGIPTSVKKIVRETISSEMSARAAVISESTNSTNDLASNVTASVERVVRVAVRSEMSARTASIEKEILARAPIGDWQLDVAGRKPSARILSCHDNEVNEENSHKSRCLTGSLTELESDSEGENMLETATSYARRKEEEDSRRNVVSITDDSEDCSLYHALFLGGKKQL